jgi:hypothetical protein
MEILELGGGDPAEAGIFVGATTLERDVYDVSSANRRICLQALAGERIPQTDKTALAGELNRDQPTMDSEAFLDIVGKAGKGSFAQRLAAAELSPEPPPHVRAALERIAS